MNTVHTTPQVQGFVTAVRGRLVDLTEEEREELVGGLDADMSDLVAERGVEALPDPATYVAELRSAAGFTPEVATRRRGARGARDRVIARLDRGSATWDAWVDTGDHLGLPELATTLRPVWWVLRATCAAALVISVFGSQAVTGLTLNRAVLVFVLALVSVQIGRGAWWPGNLVHRSLFLRLVLIGLNIFAIALLPVMASRFMAPRSEGGVYYGAPSYGDPSGSLLTFRGKPVSNVYAYDAQGHPLTGVQLVDEDGARLTIDPQQYDDMTGTEKLLTPWMNGRTELYSVFPLPEQTRDPVTNEPTGETVMQPPPYASLPPVTLAGVTPSVLVVPAPVRQAPKAPLRRKAGSTG